MQYERKIIDVQKGIVQITCVDERWYSKPNEKKEVVYIPSITWITNYYPKGRAYWMWLASQKNWDEAEAIKEAAGERGKFVHSAIEMLLKGATVNHDTIIEVNNEKRELAVDEYAAVMSFVDWFKETKPIVKQCEFTVFAPDNRFAGTLDMFCEINGEPWIIDFKTSSEIWPSHQIQISAYRNALGIDAKLGILQVGYKKNKKKYKFTEVEYDMPLFEAAYIIWSRECAKIQPLQRDFPLSLSLNKKES